MSRCRDWFVKLLALGLLGGRAVPVPQHLKRQNRVEREARNEVIEDERVRDLLKRREDAREGAE